MSKKRGKRYRVAGLAKSIGNRKSVGVFLYPRLSEETEKSVVLEFVRPIEQSDFNNDGFVKNPTVSSHHKKQLVTWVRIGETTARALRDILDVMLLNLDSQPSTS